MSPQVQSLLQEAHVLQGSGNVAEAVRRCRKALRLEPGNLALSALMGTLLAQQGDLEQAARFFGNVARARPQDADTQFNLGVVLQGQGRHAEALERLRRSVELRGERFDALAAMALSLRESGRPEEALAKYRRALELEPRAAQVHNDLGNALQELGRYEEAVDHYRAAIAVEPQYTLAHNNLGNALSVLGRFADAAESYQRALAIDPANADARYYLGLLDLLRGNYREGWPRYEARLERPERGKPRSLPGKRWQGTEDLQGRSIVLLCEQGLGDTIQFARYVPMVAAKGARVTLEVYAPLAPLLAALPGVERLVVQGEALPAADYHCPLPSLPLAFGTTLESIPQPIAFIARAPKRAGTPRVGLCWRGNAGYVSDRRRSASLRLFEPLLRTPGIEFTSLQKDLTSEEAQVGGLKHTDADFAATAQLIADLDLVITVDTAWAHWSASIGVPTWVLISNAPHWTWLLERRSSPWYPAVRLFRQDAPEQWTPLVERVSRALVEWRRDG